MSHSVFPFLLVYIFFTIHSWHFLFVFANNPYTVPKFLIPLCHRSAHILLDVCRVAGATDTGKSMLSSQRTRFLKQFFNVDLSLSIQLCIRCTWRNCRPDNAPIKVRLLSSFLSFCERSSMSRWLNSDTENNPILKRLYKIPKSPFIWDHFCEWRSFYRMIEITQQKKHQVSKILCERLTVKILVLKDLL